MSGLLDRSVTRRTALKGAAVGIAATAVASGASGCSSQSTSQTTQPTVVDSSSATSITDSFTTDGVTSPLTEGQTFQLALGLVPHEAEGTWLPVVATSASASVMTTADALSIKSGTDVTVVSKPHTSGANWVIYDARCSDSVYAWSELNLLDRSWKLYASSFSGGELTGVTTTLWESDSDWDPPALACSGSKVLWLVMPSSSGSKTAQHSGCYLWKVGDSSADEVVDSPGRFACAPTISQGIVTLVPRVNASSGTYYGITAYDLSGDFSSTVDQLVMPQTVKPFNAVRMGDRFAFSVEANYSSGGLLAGMGTYIGESGGPFVTLSREPFACVAGKGDLFVIKSRASYFVADVADQTYTVLTAYNRSLDYGEYPACVGTVDDFVTYATVKEAETGYPSAVVVRTFGL